MSDVKSVEANDNWKLYQHQMLLLEGKFELQSIEADQEDDQKADQDLTQILLRSDSESDSDSKLELKANQNSIEEMISIQNQIIVENQTNQLCFDIQIIMKQNGRTYQDIDLDNCKVLDEVLWKDDRLWVLQSMIILTWIERWTCWDDHIADRRWEWQSSATFKTVTFVVGQKHRKIKSMNCWSHCSYLSSDDRTYH